MTTAPTSMSPMPPEELRESVAYFAARWAAARGRVPAEARAALAACEAEAPGVLEAILFSREAYLFSPWHYTDEADEANARPTVWRDDRCVREGEVEYAEAALWRDPHTDTVGWVCHWASPESRWWVGVDPATDEISIRPCPEGVKPLYAERVPTRWLHAARVLATTAGTYDDGIWRMPHWAIDGRNPRAALVESERVPDDVLTEPAVAAWLAGGELTSEVQARLGEVYPGLDSAVWVAQEAVWRRLAPPVLGVEILHEVMGGERYEGSWSRGLFADPAIARLVLARETAVLDADEAESGDSGRFFYLRRRAVMREAPPPP